MQLKNWTRSCSNCLFGNAELEVGIYANFPLLKDLILKDETWKESDIFISMRKEFCWHLDTLQTSFEGYFNVGSLKDEAWIRNSFLIDLL